MIVQAIPHQPDSLMISAGRKDRYFNVKGALLTNCTYLIYSKLQNLKSIQWKSDEDLAMLYEMGLKAVFMGLESGLRNSESL
jgi:hypothetical protein